MSNLKDAIKKAADVAEVLADDGNKKEHGHHEPKPEPAPHPAPAPKHEPPKHHP